MNKLLFRAGRIEDLPAVQEICREVWDGHDYIPYVWHEWIADTSNLVYVAEIDEQIAGFYSLLLLKSESEKVGWWQGVRVAPSFRQKGIATELLAHAKAMCKEYQLSMLRYATGEPNHVMHRMAERHNFRYISPYIYWYAPAKADLPEGEVRPLGLNELEEAWRLIQGSKSWQASEGLHCDFWVWQALDFSRLQEGIKQGCVYGCFEDGSLAALAITVQAKESDDTWFFVTWLDGTPTGITTLAHHLKYYATQVSPEIRVSLMLVQDSETEQLLQQAGYEVSPDDDMRVYELAIA